MILVGLTGSIASGKSLVASLWAERGAIILDADRIGHEVIAPGGAACDGVLRNFGADIMGPGGTIDRKKLGRIVFGDPIQLSRLEAIVHPALLAELERRINEAPQGSVVVVDAALIFEFGIEEAFDLVVCITTPVDRQIARIMERGLSESEARKRVDAQMPAAAKAAKAGHVIENNGDRGELADAAALVWNEIMNLPERRRSSPVRLIRKDPPS